MRAIWIFLCAVLWASSIWAQTNDLERFVGKKLGRLSKKDTARLQQIVGPLPKPAGRLQPYPWHVWKVTRGGTMRYVLLAVSSEVIVPGGSSACVQIFDSVGIRLNTWCFQTGNRMTPEAAAFEYSYSLHSDVIVLNMTRFINGYDIAKEFFALKNDQLRFVRIENSKGEAVQNEYIYPNMEIGFAPSAKTEAEWMALLESDEKCDRLVALVFLGGSHVWKTGVLPEKKSRYSELFLNLKSSPRIEAAIAALVKSSDPWIHQAAVLAARDPWERPR